MSEDLIRRSDAIDAIEPYLDYIEIIPLCGAKPYVREAVYGIRSKIKFIPTIEPKTKVIAQITFDEEKLREIVKEAVERFKEEYEITDRPQGEWVNRDPHWHTAICSNCNKVTMFEEWDEKVIEYDFCPNCGARMKGVDDE